MTMYTTTMKAQLKHNHVHDIKASLSSFLIKINLWTCGFYFEPYFLHISGNGVLTLNN
jgi:hypothetical protein